VVVSETMMIRKCGAWAMQDNTAPCARVVETALLCLQCLIESPSLVRASSPYRRWDL